MTTYLEDVLNHPLDEPTAFGCTLHGLVLSDTTRRVGNRVWPVPAGYMSSLRFSPERHVEDFGDTHLLRVPGQPELGWDAEVLEAEALAGRVWQNYALLSGMGPGLFGHALLGWIYIDASGGRWLIRPAENYQSPWGGQLSKGGSAELGFTVRPFGELGVDEAEPWSVGVSLADIGQDDPPDAEEFAGEVRGGALVYMRVASISSTGRQMVIGLYPSITYENDVRDLPYGFLLLEVTGSGSGISLGLSVLRTRRQTLGAFDIDGFDNHVMGEFVATPSLEVTVLETDDLDRVTKAEGVLTVSGFAFYETSVSPAWPHAQSGVWVGTGRAVHSVRGRIMMLVFDDSDTLVEFTADMSSEFEINDQANPAGHNMRWQVELRGGYSQGTTLSDTATFQYRHDQRLARTVRLYRAGLKLQEVEANYTLTGSYTWGASVAADTLLPATPTFSIDWLSATVQPNIAFGRTTHPSSIGVPQVGGMWRWDASISVDGSGVENAGGDTYRDMPTTVPWQWHRVMTTFQLTPGAGVLGRQFDYAVQRLSNNLLAGRYELSGGGQAVVYKVPAAFAAQAIRLNTATGNDDINRRVVRGSYHPLTHEIHLVTRAANDDYPFGVWV